MTDKSLPILILDSGIGGLFLTKHLHLALPNEDLVYLADTKNMPYGNRSKKELFDLACQNIEYLHRAFKCIFFACTTLSTNTQDEIAKKYSIPILGTHAPIQNYLETFKNEKKALIATSATIRALDSKKSDLLFPIETPLLAPLIEKDIHSPQLLDTLRTYLKPVQEKHILHLILGCTHYSLVYDQIQSIVGREVNVFDPTLECLEQLKKTLASNLNPQKKGHIEIFATKNLKRVMLFAQKELNTDVTQ